jgi:hypothetical protein
LCCLSAADPSLPGLKRAAPARPITLPRMMRGVRGQERFPSRGQVLLAYRVRVNFAKPRTTPDLPGHVAAGAVGCLRGTSRSHATRGNPAPSKGLVFLAAAFGLGCTCGLAAILAGLHADLLRNFSHTWIHLLSGLCAAYKAAGLGWGNQARSLSWQRAVTPRCRSRMVTVLDEPSLLGAEVFMWLVQPWVSQHLSACARRR